MSISRTDFCIVVLWLVNQLDQLHTCKHRFRFFCFLVRTTTVITIIVTATHIRIPAIATTVTIVSLQYISERLSSICEAIFVKCDSLKTLVIGTLTCVVVRSHYTLRNLSCFYPVTREGHIYMIISHHCIDVTQIQRALVGNWMILGGHIADLELVNNFERTFVDLSDCLS